MAVQSSSTLSQEGHTDRTVLPLFKKYRDSNEQYSGGVVNKAAETLVLEIFVDLSTMAIECVS